MCSSNFFQARSVGQARTDPEPPAQTNKSDKKEAYADELKEYLALPQIENTSEWAGLEWWEENAEFLYFLNLSVMARQYLGCPATSATVERLFSMVGIAFSDKRKRSSSETLLA